MRFYRLFPKVGAAQLGLVLTWKAMWGTTTSPKKEGPMGQATSQNQWKDRTWAEHFRKNPPNPVPRYSCRTVFSLNTVHIALVHSDHVQILCF